MSDATRLLCDLIKLEMGTMSKFEIRKNWKGHEWGPLRPWAVWIWRNAGL